MDANLRLLLVEHAPLEAQVIKETLQLSVYSFTTKRVETKDQFLLGLDEFKPDVVLANFSLPSFNGMVALKLVRERDPDLPFIFVSNMLGEEEAMEILKVGATDFIHRRRLVCLVPAVERALFEAHLKAKHKQTEKERERLIQELQDARDHIRKLSGLLPICSWCKKARNDKGYWEEVENYIRDHPKIDFTRGICRECMTKFKPTYIESNAKR
jgi:DNA-binding NtrC family response regulator